MNGVAGGEPPYVAHLESAPSAETVAAVERAAHATGLPPAHKVIFDDDGVVGGEPTPYRQGVDRHPSIGDNEYVSNSDSLCGIEHQPGRICMRDKDHDSGAGGEPTRPSEQEWLEAVGGSESYRRNVYDSDIAPLIERERAFARTQERALTQMVGDTELNEACEKAFAAGVARVVAAVEAQHAEDTFPTSNGGTVHTRICMECADDWPCATVRAARGATGGGT